ncbi:MAG: hypothetical protein WC801_05965 [Patescibacteria group bacterium]|jgi:hypothetical protein
MLQKIPKELLSSEYRIEMWKNSQKIIKKLEKVLPISSAYLLGSFTTEKKRPADVDFIILLQMKDKSKFNWSVDFVVAPTGEHGEFILEDAKKWMKQKYGTKKSAVIKLK